MAAADRHDRIVRQTTQLGLDNAIELRALTPILSSSGLTTPSFAKQRGKQMQGIDLRIAAIGSHFLRPLNGFLGFDGEFIESKGHIGASC